MIDNWCNQKKSAFELAASLKAAAALKAATALRAAHAFRTAPHMQCLAANIDQCRWGDDEYNADGDDWDQLYKKCNLNELSEVTPLHGKTMIDNWCNSKKSQTANWNCLENNHHMCHWGEWSALYSQCKLYEIPEVNLLSGAPAIHQWCATTKAHFELSAMKYAEEPMMCLAENYGMCQWDNKDTRGLPTGGWSDLVAKCNIQTGVQGSEECTDWCMSHKGNVETYNCLRNNANMCHWGEWSALYSKCNLNTLPSVGHLSGSTDITQWCDKKVGAYMST